MLTPDNHEELLSEAAGRSKREVEELLARRFPRPDAPASIRRLPPARVAPIRPSGRGWPHASPQRPRSAPVLTAGRASADIGTSRHPPARPTKRALVATPLAWILPDPVHGQRGDARQASPGAGPPPSRAALRRSGRDLRSRSNGAPPGRPGKCASVRTPPNGATTAAGSRHPGQRSAGGLGPRSGSMSIRRGLGTPLRRTRLPRVPPRPRVRGRGPGDGREHPAQVPRPQCV
jgi:hypothetical protein